MVQKQIIGKTAVGLIGGALLAAGLVLPWTQLNPAHHGPYPAVYLAGMRSGIQWTDYILLGGTIVALLTILSQRQTTTANWEIVGTGGVVLLVSGINIVSYLPSYWPVFIPPRCVPDDSRWSPSHRHRHYTTSRSTETRG